MSEASPPPETLRLAPRRALAIATALALFALWWLRIPALEAVEAPAERPTTYYSRTAIRERVNVQEAGTWALELEARSTHVAHQNARLVVRVDRRVVGELHVVRPGFGVYWLPFELDRGQHFVEVAFDNDRSRFPEDLDLVVRSMRLRSPTATPPSALPRLSAGDSFVATALSLRRGALLDTKTLTLLEGGSAGDAFLVERAGALQIDVHRALRAAAGSDAVPAKIELRVNDRPCAERPAPQDGVSRFSCEVIPGLDLLRLRNAGPGLLTLSHLAVQAPGAADVLPAPPQHELVAPGHFSPARHGETTTGAPDRGGWLLYRKGNWSARVRFEQGGAHEIAFDGGGTLLEGVGPAVYLLLDGVQTAVFDVSEEQAREYRTSFELDAGVHELTLAFANDDRSETEDRNFWLGEVRIR